MSTLMNQARTRVPRFAEAAVERARLTVVPRSSGRQAARVPFFMLISVLLVGGVAGLLLLNTTMQQVSFRQTALQDRATLLAAQKQSLDLQLDQLRDPQRLAERAQRMGMIPAAAPAFMSLGTGKVLGKPMPATPDNSFRITPLPTRKPKNLDPSPVVETLRPAPVSGAAAGVTGVATGRKSTSTRPTTQQGSHR